MGGRKLDAHQPNPKPMKIRIRTLLLFIIYFLSMGFALGQDDCGWIKRKNLIAKPAKIWGKSMNPWRSNVARVPASWKVGLAKDIKTRPGRSKSLETYNIAQIHKGRLVSCAFVGFFIGHVENSGGGIDGMTPLRTGVATVALATLIPLRSDQSHREGILKTKLASFFCCTVAYSLGYGIAQNLTPNLADI